MTLILAMVNREQAVLVSDRRLTINGQLTDDDSNKAAAICVRDARLALAFTGLARAGSFVTNRWLAKSLADIAKPEHLMEPLIDRFVDLANRDISQLPVRIDKRLTFVFVGYSHDFDPPRACLWRVSNFEGGPTDHPSDQAAAEFTKVLWIANHPPPECVCLFRSFGSKVAVSATQMSSLHDLLHGRKPARALVGKAVAILHEAADSPAAEGTIGKRATSIVLPSDPYVSYSAEYHSDQATHRVGGVTHIEARGGEHGVWVLETESNETFDAAGRPVISVFPKVGRNEPCPCGSGRKYKICHGQP